MAPDERTWMDELADQLTARIAEVVRQAIDDSALKELIDGLSQSLDGVAGAEDTERDADADGADKKRCAEAGCPEPARARGLCSKHYQRLRYAEKRAEEEGEPPPTSLEEAAAKRTRKAARKTSKRGGGLCSQEGCDRPNYAKGMCGKHFMEWVRSRKE